MATKGLASASPCALRLTLSFVVVGIAANVHAGPFDYVNLKQFNKNLALILKHINNTPPFPANIQETALKKSSRALRNLPNREISEKRDENRPEFEANEESKWQKQMEELSRKSMNKTGPNKGLRSPELDYDSLSLEDLDINEDQYQRSREVFRDRNNAKDDTAQDFVTATKARMRMLKEDLYLLESGENKSVEDRGKAERNEPGTPNKFPNLTKLLELRKRVRSRSKGTENGRWGFNGGFERLLTDVKEKGESAGKFVGEIENLSSSKHRRPRKIFRMENGERRRSKGLKNW